MRNRHRWLFCILGVLPAAILLVVVGNPFSSISHSAHVFAAGVPLLSASATSEALPHIPASLATATRQLSPPRQYGPLGHGKDVVTYHYNVTRQGLNQFETILNLSNVNADSFGLVGFFPVDGKVDAQPLYLYRMPVGRNLRNILYVATENDSVYAFDADHGQQLWRTSALLPGEAPSDDIGCTLITPTIGITATPVIDRQRGVMYLVAMTRDSYGNYHQRLHALDLSTGAERFGAPIEIDARYPGSGDGSVDGVLFFDPRQYTVRAGLLEYAGKIYFAFTSHCDSRPITGWLMAYDAQPLRQSSILNLTPNGYQGAVWMSGAGLAADGQGNVYLLNANGLFDTAVNDRGMPLFNDYGNCFLKISTSPKLAVADYFTMFDTMQESDDDVDLGSGGALVLPDLYDDNGQLHHLAVGAGKEWQHLCCRSQ